MSVPSRPDTLDTDCQSSSFAAACGEPLRALSLTTLQVNIGLVCNLACRHCHVESSPKRREAMSWETMQAVLELARAHRVPTIDITGGAPEMHPHFEAFVAGARDLGAEVIVRTNLTVMLLEPYRHLPRWLADRRVHLVASLPCYFAENVDRQRGKWVHRDSIAVLQELNQLGYGRVADRQLDLVYNPLGPQLPGDPRELETLYRRELRREYGIEFHHLHVLTNLPIGRFVRDVERRGEADAYWSLLKRSFNPATLPHLMCRHQWHVGWDGRLYDCDFNFALGIPCKGAPTVHDVDPRSQRGRTIVTGNHCFGCTAGRGSSCSGTLVAE